MDDDSDHKDTFRLKTFTGKHPEWPEWSKKFLAVALDKEVRCYLLPDNGGCFIIPTRDEWNDHEGEIQALGDAAVRNWKGNAKAYSLLIRATKNTPFQKVKNAKTVALPDGDAREAWRVLME